LAACGGSSSSTTSTTASTTTSTRSSGGGADASRFAAIRACLQKEGTTLPQRPSATARPNGSARPNGGIFGGGAPGGGPQLPSGVSRAKYEAALKKCGGGTSFGRRNFNSAADTQALTKFASCMRENGINLPAPNTSGSGPVFDTKGIDTTGSKFTAAEAKCRSDLPARFGRRGPPGGGAGAGSSAPAQTTTG
jgi:hypothetical protein